MKRLLFSSICSLIIFNLSYSQNPINPYGNYIGAPPPGYSISQSGLNFSYTALEADNVPAYNGEYMIDLHKLFWYTQNGGGFDQNFYAMRKSYTMEVVSFPFTMDCAFTPGTGCAGTIGRALNLPSAPYSTVTNTWGSNLWRIRDHIPFADGSGVSGTVINAESLITNGFHTTCYETPPTPPDNYYRSYLPHTIIKHTVYIHCGPDETDPIATLISWVYDNTRGRMRDYPFIPQNANCNPCEALYDVCFRPFILHQPDMHLYDENDNNLLYTNGSVNGTIDYFPHGEIDPASCWNRPSDIDYFFLEDNNPPTPDYWFPFIGNYSLLSSLLYQARGKRLAGYDYNAQNNIYLELEGIKHTYTINSNIDLSTISPLEKIIYNPSEADVTASNLIFPSHYTFKTVRGAYPIESEVDADNISVNGGPYYPKHLTPVTTDLVSENPLDPIGEHVYASRYYLKAGSMITINPCVKLFDVTFDIEKGATLVIDDYDQIYGKEDKSFFNGRFKLRGFGGAILRNNTTHQYLQNGIIDQTTSLNYIAYNSITAGSNVDIDIDQQSGNYQIMSGADVTFTAGEFIHLTNGFYVQGGNFHAVINPNMEVPPQCFGQNRFVSSDIKQKLEKRSTQVPSLKVTPNPTLENILVENISTVDDHYTVDVYDFLGQKVLTAKAQKGKNLNIENLIPGFYVLKVIESNQTIKFIKQ